MMKLINVPILIIICMSNCVFAQYKGKSFFELSVASDHNGPAKKESYIVFFNSQKSIEFIQKGQVSYSAQRKNEIVETKTVKHNGGKKFIFKDFKRNKLTVYRGILFKNYLISDTLSNFKWKLTNDRKEILHYNCTKAITRFRGRNYEEWYTEDIPIQNGPWKFCGLPGFIIRVSDDKQDFIYQLTSIDVKTNFDDRIFELPNKQSNDNAISYANFMILYHKKLAENDKLSKLVETTKEGYGRSISITLPQNMEKF